MVAKTTKRRRKGNVTTVDMSGVESGGASVPDGRYAAKIIEVEEKEGKESGEPFMQLSWEITSKKCGGRTVKFDNYSLQPQALWRLKGLLEALEIEVPDGEMEIDWDELIKDEAECILEIIGQKSPDGDRVYARVTGFAPLSDGGTVDDDEGEDDPKASKRGKSGTRTSSPRDDDADDDNDDKPARRGKPSKDDDDDDDGEERPTRRSSGSRKLKKGAEVSFKDERGKKQTGEVTDIDGDKVTVETEKDTYEIDADEVTVL